MIDTHCHLLMFDENGKKIIESMQDCGLKKLVTIGTTIEDSRKSIQIAQENKDVFAAVGIYPEYAETTTEEDFEMLKKLAQSKKVVAIGEIGLDYHTEGYNREAQRKTFLRQMQIADELGLPFCIHCRNAASDVYEILNFNRHLLKHSALMHCYSEGAEWIDKFLELGLYISFSGNITYKKSDRSFLNRIPLDKLLVETDAPYLSPEPLRGTKNEPKNVRFVIDKIALELGENPAKIERITEQNALSFYKKIQEGE